MGQMPSAACPVLGFCDPRTGLSSGQYFNPNCFTSPLPSSVDASGNFIPGRNGQAVWPYIHGPAYISHDLSLYKTFAITESKSVQFRMNAFNFPNHPLQQFGLGSDSNLAFSGLTSIEDGNGGYIQPTSCTLGAPECNHNSTTNGKPFGKVGRRVMEFAVKFTF